MAASLGRSILAREASRRALRETRSRAEPPAAGRPPLDRPRAVILRPARRPQDGRDARDERLSVLDRAYFEIRMGGLVTWSSPPRSDGAAHDAAASSRPVLLRSEVEPPCGFSAFLSFLGLCADKIASAVIVKLTRGSRPSGAQTLVSNVPEAAIASPSISGSSASIAVWLKAKRVHHFASGPAPSRAVAMR